MPCSGLEDQMPNPETTNLYAPEKGGSHPIDAYRGFYCRVCRDEKPKLEIAQLRAAIRKATAYLDRGELDAALSVLRERA